MRVTRYRSKLFTPGSRPERFAKAAASDADIVVLDLEDGVAPSAKDDARAAVAEALRDGTFRGRRCGVRIDGLDGDRWLEDLRAVVCDDLDEIHVPKVDDPRQLTTVVDVLTALEPERSIGVVPTIETVRGFLRLSAIVDATDRLGALQLGTADLTAELPVELDAERLGWFRAQLTVAAAAARVPAIDAVHLDARDLDGFRASAIDARRWGMAGKTCIHPLQVPVANDVFTAPTGDRDRAIVAAFDDAVARGDGVIEFEGQMIDRPVADAARRRTERR